MPTPIDLGQPTKLNCEVAVFSGAAGLEAQDLGAKRIELNAPGSYEEGGLTPPVKELTSIASQLEIAKKQQEEEEDKLQDFIYTDAEIDLMLQAIEDFKATRVLNPIRGDGFVFGVLRRQTKASTLAKYPDQKYTIDEERCRLLIEAAKPFPCVFHRAFDPIAASERWAKGIDILVRCGFDGVLTAGGHGGCHLNQDKLDAICHRGHPGSLQLIAGGGIRKGTVGPLVAQLSVHGTKNVWIHTAALGRDVDRDGRHLEELNARELRGIINIMNNTRPD
ncbi:copper homeostasis protein [Trichoderma citrinoviride]|uniref:Copper homeostasis protein cutC homolog n=1 Tax=Trichoderma citrinoviride TaxID=58853 RepID=A0A2T4B0J2_9HYPO|nr:copper homeostasis protein [Trichoderma citrinoviride]PTB62835.1 copper homeostasis protein [Trichoderma citrinoviride]